jgi:hypothetical protein
MRFFLHLVVLLAWGLWFGGTIGTFVFGLNLFHTFQARPELAGEAASAMFLIFGKYELVLAGIAVLASAILLVSYPSVRIILLLAGLILSTGMAMTFSLGLTPRMEMLRTQGKSHTPEFVQLHGKSMILMTMQSVALLLTAALLLKASGDSMPQSMEPRRHEDTKKEI